MKTLRFAASAPLAILACLSSAAAIAADAAPLPAVGGWRLAQPTPGTHQVGIDPHGASDGRGCAKIVGLSAEKGARGGLIQEFTGKAQLKPGRAYRYSVSHRGDLARGGSARVTIDSYTAEGEKSRKALVSETPEPGSDWNTLAGEFTVPERAVRVRMLLYLYGRGSVCYDDAFLGEAAAGAPNLLKNGAFELPESHVYDAAPERRSGAVRFAADFAGGTLGKVKQLGPDEFYLYAFPDDQPRPPFLWFHFRVEGCAGRELTLHVNPAPFSRDTTGGNGTRLPVVSCDGDQWHGVADKSWSADGSLLTFKHRFARSPAWIASFFPFTAEHVARLAREYAGHACFRAGTLGKTPQGADLPLWTITDPAAPAAGKRTFFFTALQHDLETTGAMALEGLCRHLLSEDPRMGRLRRAAVVYAVPMMDPDGIAAGNRYCPVGNMNRQWGLGTTPETTHVERFVKQQLAEGRKIDLFMDFHGWCRPERMTLLLTFGAPLVSDETQQELIRLADAVKPRLAGEVRVSLRNKMVSRVTSGETDLRRLASGWMQFEGSARLAYSIEIFGDGENTQRQYLDWGKAFAEGIADFYGIPPR